MPHSRTRIYPTLLVVPAIFGYFAFSGYGFVFKAAVTLSCIAILILDGYPVRRTRPAVWIIFLAFLCSIAGDWFLSHRGPDETMFVGGIFFYFLAHAAYLAFALLYGRFHRRATAIIILAYLVFFAIVLLPEISGVVLVTAVFMYLLISCLSLGASFGIDTEDVRTWSYITGIALIVFSDTIISFSEFLSCHTLNPLILPTYYAAHVFITFSLLRRERDG